MVFLNSCINKFDIICLFETWIVDDKLKFDIDGYINYNFYSKWDKSDGILVCINNLIQVNYVKFADIYFCSFLHLNFSNNETLADLT